MWTTLQCDAATPEWLGGIPRFVFLLLRSIIKKWTCFVWESVEIRGLTYPWFTRHPGHPFFFNFSFLSIQT